MVKCGTLVGYAFIIARILEKRHPKKAILCHQINLLSSAGQALDKDIEFVGDIAGRYYGSRDFRIKDNNGNMLIFSCPLINQKELIATGNTAKSEA
jgi:hypothetical protein